MGRMIRNGNKKSSSKINHSNKKKTAHIHNNNNNNNENPTTPTKASSIEPNTVETTTTTSWVDRLRFVPITTIADINDARNQNNINDSDNCGGDDDTENDHHHVEQSTTTTTTTEEVAVAVVSAVSTTTATRLESVIQRPPETTTARTTRTTATTTVSPPEPTTTNGTSTTNPTTISILTWNVLAQAYCSRRSQVELPKEFGRVVFSPSKRKQRVLHVLQQLLVVPNHNSNNSNTMDVICLQEVDMNEIRPILMQCGYTSVVETPRNARNANTTSMGGRIDGCSIYIRTNNINNHKNNNKNSSSSSTSSTTTTTTTSTTAVGTTTATSVFGADDDEVNSDDTNTAASESSRPVSSSSPQQQQQPPTSNIQWKLIDSQLIRLDDLATLSSSPSASSSSTVTTTDAATRRNGKTTTTTIPASNGQERGGNENDTEDKDVESSNDEINNGTTSISTSAATTTTATTSNIQGIQQSLLRRNMAIMVRLQHTTIPTRTIIIVNAHLFWNPSFEYVKLCQAHYILQRVQHYQIGPYEPVILCGDLNSRPNGGVTHTYLSHGSINAKRIAPWCTTSSLSLRNDTIVDPLVPTTTTTLADEHSVVEQIHDSIGNGNSDIPVDSNLPSTIETINEVDKNVREAVDESIVNGMDQINFIDAAGTTTKSLDDEIGGTDDGTPQIRYLVDASLNKLCRWLRILGQDAAIETDEEEKLRTGKSEMVIFDRCKSERRTLVTTSPRLMQRRDCPASVYCIHPPYLSHLEVVMVHMLLTHGVELIPSTFLSRCVVCNGQIIEEHDDTRKRQILTEYEAPHALIDEGMAVFVCDGCQQGYWWNDRPTSSASRVKTAATRLLELCVRAGVPVRDDDDNDDDSGMFQHVNYDQLRHEGWDYTTPGSELLQQKLDVIEWLKSDHLECPFQLESAYLDKSVDNNTTFREILPFTNVTHHFVDTLDYIFFDKTRLFAIERLDVPTTFEELSDGRTNIENAHLLPSDVWPSDHLAIAARLAFHDPVDVDQRDSVIQTIQNDTEEERHISQGGETQHILNVESSSLKFFDPNMYCGIIDSGASLPSAQPQLQQALPIVHAANDLRCACGCIPNIPSLFEMAELRKQARMGK